MITLTQTKTQPQQSSKETVTIDDVLFEVDLHLTDWKAVYSGRPTATMLAQLYSTSLEQDEPVPTWSGLVACTVAELTPAAVTEMIRSHGLTAEHYSIGQVWKPEVETEF